MVSMTCSIEGHHLRDLAVERRRAVARHGVQYVALRQDADDRFAGVEHQHRADAALRQCGDGAS
jgi:hypothetical protein